MKKNKVDLTITITSLSTNEYHTKDCLEVSLRSMVNALKKVNFELIIVDNSTIDDGTKKMVKKYFPSVVYLKRNEIHDFGDNNNFAFKRSNGRYILFLNNDVEVLDNNTFSEMISWMDKNENVGAVTCGLLNADKKTLQGSGGSFPDLFRVFAWMTFIDDLPFFDKLIKPMHPMHDVSPIGSNEDYFKVSHSQDWITGAFYMVRKEILDKIGVFDEDYNAYMEETDLSYRIKKEGWDILYMPKWKIVHFGGQSYGSERSLIYELKNLKLFYKKHYPAWQLPILNIVIKLGCILRIIVFTVFKPSLVKIYAKAIKTV